MCTPPRAFALAIGAALALVSATAFGWSHSTTEHGDALHWDSPKVVYTVDAAADLGSADLVDATCRGARVWSEVGGITIGVACTAGQDLVPGYVDDGPNVNSVTVADDGWTGDGAHLALTVSTYAVDSGALLDTDILVASGADATWSTRGVLPADAYDLHTAVTHELGHGLGLGHEFENTDAVMYPTLSRGHTDRRELDDDDRWGLRALYGDGTEPVYGGGPVVDDPPADTPPPTDATTEPAPAYDEPTTAPETHRSSPAAWTGDEGLEVEGRDHLNELDCSSAGVGGAAPLALALALLLLARRPRRSPTGPNRRRPVRWGVALLAALVVSAPALVVADTARVLPVDELVAHADTVVIGEVVETTTRWDGGFIVTDATVRVAECVIGPCDATIVVSSLGGEVGGIGQRVAGAAHWTPGDDVLVFAAHQGATHRAVAMSQGVFNVRAAEGGPVAIRALDDMVLLHPVEGHVMAPAVERYDLAALVRIVAETSDPW